jgi:hypothetical protein
MYAPFVHHAMAASAAQCLSEHVLTLAIACSKRPSLECARAELAASSLLISFSRHLDFDIMQPIALFCAPAPNASHMLWHRAYATLLRVAPR